MQSALTDESGTRPFVGPVEFLETRLDLPIQVSDALFEEAPLLCGQHANDPGVGEHREEEAQEEGLLPQDFTAGQFNVPTSDLLWKQLGRNSEAIQ